MMHGVTRKKKDKNHVISQSNEWTSHKNQEVEPVQRVQMNIYKSNTCTKNLSQPPFYDDTRGQERQQVLDQQPNISVSVSYLTYSSSNQEHQLRHNINIPCKAVQQIFRDKEQILEKETLQNESRLQFSWRRFEEWRQCKTPNPIQ